MTALRRGTPALACVAIGLALAGCGGGDPGRTPRVRNVLLLTVDTLRADQLGCYGAAGDPTPNLDRLAGGSVLFDAAYSQATHTHSALSSVLTGLVPPRHGVPMQSGKYARNVRPLAHLLREAGVETGCFVANMCRLHDHPSNVFSEGWDELHCAMSYGEDDKPTGEQWAWDQDAVESAVTWIQSTDGPWFAWVHLMDPHAEHRPPVDLWDYDAQPIRSKPDQYRYYAEFERAREAPPGDVLDTLWRQYAAESRGADRAAGFLLDALATRDDWDETAVVFSADHGEELFETWPKYGHGFSLTEGVLHVPLLVRAPGLDAGARADLVNTLQITPTVLALYDVPAPYPLDGRDLLAEPRDDAFAVSYCGRVATLRQGDRRVWVHSEHLESSREIDQYLRGTPFHLAQPWYEDGLAAALYGDPASNAPSAWLEQGRAADVYAQLERHLRRLGDVPAPELIDDPNLQNDLDALGYGGGEADDEASDGS